MHMTTFGAHQHHFRYRGLQFAQLLQHSLLHLQAHQLLNTHSTLFPASTPNFSYLQQPISIVNLAFFSWLSFLPRAGNNGTISNTTLNIRRLLPYVLPLTRAYSPAAVVRDPFSTLRLRWVQFFFVFILLYPIAPSVTPCFVPHLSWRIRLFKYWPPIFISTTSPPSMYRFLEVAHTIEIL
jgi:hypothetical protein